MRDNKAHSLIAKTLLTIIVSNDRYVLVPKEHLMSSKVAINEVEKLRYVCDGEAIRCV